MGAFIKRVLAPIRVEPVPPDYRSWIVFDTFEYRLGSPDGPEFVRIEKGFETDFASIPRGLWNLLPPTGYYGKAAVLHDYLYRCTDVPRDICDRVFLEAMEVLQVKWITRRLMYRAVRIFGGRARKKMEA